MPRLLLRSGEEEEGMLLIRHLDARLDEGDKASEFSISTRSAVHFYNQTTCRSVITKSEEAHALRGGKGHLHPKHQRGGT